MLSHCMVYTSSVLDSYLVVLPVLVVYLYTTLSRIYVNETITHLQFLIKFWFLFQSDDFEIIQQTSNGRTEVNILAIC